MSTVLSLSWCLTLFCLADEPREVSFDREIVPILTKSGCNAGSCHGAAAGRGDFHLSLLGSNPLADHRVIFAAFRGRRVNLHQPARSLLLRKPTGELEHGGGQVLDLEQSDGQTILRWIERGAKHDAAPPLRRLALTPFQTHFTTVPSRTTIQAEATFADGSTIDVTKLVTFSTMDPTAIRLDPFGEVHLLRPGQHVLLARYMDQVVSVQLSSPLGDALPDHAWEKAENFVDLEVLKTLDSLRIPPSPRADDAQWLRRVHLDLTGRLPTSEVATDFLQTVTDTNRTTSRAMIVDGLLDSPEYADYWAWRLAGELRMRSFPNEPQPLDAYYHWLREMIQEDQGFDQLARSLLTSDGDSHAIGPANFGRMVRDAREHAELVGQFFAGARLGCANCHDHPLDRWTQDDYHGLAAVFARLQRTRHVSLGLRGEVTNVRTSEPATSRIPGQRDLTNIGDHRNAVAQWVLDDEQDLFARVMVNRFWQAMFGRGLVEPVDDLRQTNPATHPELLTKLARDFAANGFRLRHTLRLLALSQSYARSKEVLPGNQADDRFYSRAFPRPMEPAILVDAIQDVTGVREALAGANITRAVHLVDASRPSATLDALGRCQLAQGCETTQAGTYNLSAQLQLLNGDVINRKLRDPTGRWQRQVAEKLPVETIIQEWYMVALSRTASVEELEHWTKELATNDAREQQERLEDFIWSLLNSRAFIER
ncbi:MAG: DUF1553 domain-containing protein [Pirellulaceae bacterium]|nr:DUF1553 domain-containing protein [Pirellulaceae bacterium]